MTPSRRTIIDAILIGYSVAASAIIYKLIVYIYQNHLTL